MKKFLLIAFIAMLSTSAFAENRPGTVCLGDGQLSQTGRAVLSCRDGKWMEFSTVGTAMVSIKVVVMDGETVLFSSQVNTLDGQPAPIVIEQEMSYVAGTESHEREQIVSSSGKVKTGIYLTLTPVLVRNGNIDVDFTISKSDLDSIQTYEQGDSEVPPPQITLAGLTQKVEMVSGQETVIPFGPLVTPKNLSPAHTKYTLKMVVTKV